MAVWGWAPSVLTSFLSPGFHPWRGPGRGPVRTPQIQGLPVPSFAAALLFKQTYLGLRCPIGIMGHKILPHRLDCPHLAPAMACGVVWSMSVSPVDAKLSVMGG